MRCACLALHAVDQCQANASRELTSKGKLPHDVELEKHPEKSIEGKMWLMGDVSALIHVSDRRSSKDDQLTSRTSSRRKLSSTTWSRWRSSVCSMAVDWSWAPLRPSCEL